MSRTWKRVFRLPWHTTARDVDAELRFHIDERTAELVAQGSNPSEARAQAVKEFGDPDAVRWELIDIDTRIAKAHTRRDTLEAILLPFRFAIRRLSRQPGFFALTAGSLALALGAATGAVGFADAWKHPVNPFDAPDRTAIITMWGGPDRQHGGMFALDRWSRIENTSAFESVAWTTTTCATPIFVGDESLRDCVNPVSANFAEVSGVHMIKGRSFIAGSGDDNAVIVSDFLWRRYFGNRRNIGEAFVSIDGQSHQVIGVLPRNQTWPLSSNIYTMMSGVDRMSWPIVRLKPGTTPEGTQKALEATAAIMNVGNDPVRPYGFTVHAFTDKSDHSLDGIHYIMMIVAGFVLLIACANVSALLLARAASRRRDLALRLALGAGHGALVADVIAELVVISVAGLIGGLAIANSATGAVRSLIPPEITWSLFVEMAWSWRVFAISGGILVFVVAIVGLLPALQVSRIPPMEPLKGSSGGAIARRPQRMKSVVMIQLAASLVLLIVTSVLVASAANLQMFDYGFDPRRVVSVTGNFVYKWNTTKLGGQSPTQYIIPRALGAKGISVVTFYGSGKPDGLQITSDDIARDSRPMLAEQYTIAGPRFMETIGVQVVEGRDFIEGDSIGDGAVILDDSAAKALFPSGSAVGRRVRLGRYTSNEPWRPVIGVSRSISVRFPSAQVRGPAVYVATSLPETRSFAVLARAATPDDAPLAPPRVRREVGSVLPLSVALSVKTLSADREAAARSREQFAQLFGMLALGALLFAAAGLFAVLSYMVSQRMREFAVRVAIGAKQSDVIRLVLCDTFELALGGTAIGGAAGVTVVFVYGSQMFDIDAANVLALIASELILLTVAVIAAVGPAVRATRADPVDVLRAS